MHSLDLEEILGEYDKKELTCVERSTDGNLEGKNEGTELGSSYVSFYGSNDYNI